MRNRILADLSRLKTWWIALSLCLGGAAFAGEEHFPIDERMRVRVDFWKKVYTEISSTQGFVHDILEPWIIYSKIDFGRVSRRKRRRIFRKEKKKVQAVLDSIIRKKKENLSEAEAKILAQIGDRDVSTLKKMKRRIRVQIGLSDNYLIGLKRSYLYLDRIREILKKKVCLRSSRFYPMWRAPLTTKLTPK